MGDKLTRRYAKDCFDEEDKEAGQELFFLFFFSVSLRTKNRFETGLKFVLSLGHLGQEKFFFQTGLTMAAFIQEGKSKHKKVQTNAYLF